MILERARRARHCTHFSLNAALLSASARGVCLIPCSCARFHASIIIDIAASHCFYAAAHFKFKQLLELVIISLCALKVAKDHCIRNYRLFVYTLDFTFSGSLFRVIANWECRLYCNHCGNRRAYCWRLSDWG